MSLRIKGSVILIISLGAVKVNLYESICSLKLILLF